MLPQFMSRCPDTCETCRFWQPDEEFDDNVLGECRLKARLGTARPAGRAVVGAPGQDAAADAWLVETLARRPWPLTESRDWCNDWRASGAHASP